MATDFPTASRVKTALAPIFRRQATWFIVRGVLALAFGVAALLFPGLALFAATLVFAAYSLADGIASIIAGFHGKSAGAAGWGPILRGIIGIAIGVLFIAMPGSRRSVTHLPRWPCSPSGQSSPASSRSSLRYGCARRSKASG